MTKGRREIQREKTRRAISEAAVSLSAELGYDHVTVEMIAEKADISYRTFFNYFESKEDAIFVQHEDRIGQLRELVLELTPDLSLTETVQAVVDGILDQYKRDRRTVQQHVAIVQSAPHLGWRMAAMAHRVEACLIESYTERLGLEGDHVLPHYLAKSTIGIVSLVAGPPGLPRPELPTETVLAECFGYLDKGLGQET